MGDQAQQSIAILKSTGDWYNTSRTSRMVSHFRILQDDEGRLWMEAHGAEGGVHPGSWGKAEVAVFVNNPEKPEDDGLMIDVQLENMKITFSVYYNHGILVVAGHTTYTDGSGQAGLFTREFYYKSPNTPWK